MSFNLALRSVVNPFAVWTGKLFTKKGNNPVCHNLWRFDAFGAFAGIGFSAHFRPGRSGIKYGNADCRSVPHFLTIAIKQHVKRSLG